MWLAQLPPKTTRSTRVCLPSLQMSGTRKQSKWKNHALPSPLGRPSVAEGGAGLPCATPSDPAPWAAWPASAAPGLASDPEGAVTAAGVASPFALGATGAGDAPAAGSAPAPAPSPLAARLARTAAARERWRSLATGRRYGRTSVPPYPGTWMSLTRCADGREGGVRQAAAVIVHQSLQQSVCKPTAHPRMQRDICSTSLSLLPRPSTFPHTCPPPKTMRMPCQARTSSAGSRAGGRPLPATPTGAGRPGSGQRRCRPPQTPLPAASGRR